MSKETVRFSADGGAVVDLTGFKTGFRVYREAAGRYWLIFPAGEGRPLAEYDFSITMIGDDLRTAQLVAGDPPVGATLTTGQSGQGIGFFDLDGVAADGTQAMVKIERR